MQSDQVRQTNWQYLYEQMTPVERESMVILMLKTIEERGKEVIDLCRDNPKHLETLPASKLREVAAAVSDEAHALIVSKSPEIAGELLALEGLTAFSVSADEPTLADMRDTITDIQAIWEAAGGHNDSELV